MPHPLTKTTLRNYIPLVGVSFDSEGDFGLSLYDDTESISFYKKVALKNNVYLFYFVLKSKKGFMKIFYFIHHPRNFCWLIYEVNIFCLTFFRFQY